MTVFIGIIVIYTDDVSVIEFIKYFDFIKEIFIELLFYSIELRLVFLGNKQFVNERVLKQNCLSKWSAAEVRAEESDTDSLVSEINRAASDTLPQEYYDGVYTNLTDMFYLAELFARLIDTAESCDRTDFSYNDIFWMTVSKRLVVSAFSNLDIKIAQSVLNRGSAI